MPKKSHFSIFAIQNFVQNINAFVIVHLYCWDHDCNVNEWSLVDCFHRKFMVSTQIMEEKSLKLKFSAIGGLLTVHLFHDSIYLS